MKGENLQNVMQLVLMSDVKKLELVLGASIFRDQKSGPESRTMHAFSFWPSDVSAM